jgi:HAD superfamily hydrolase (TIGR01549 family)
MTALDAVLFDFGDTLFSRRGAHTAISEVARQLGATVSDIEARQLWDAVQAKARTPAELARGRDLSPTAHREAWTALYRPMDGITAGMADLLYEREIDAAAWVAYSDTLPALEALRQAGVKLGVISDTGWDIRPIFDRAGCLDWIGSFVLSFEHAMAKPAAALFATACRELGVEPERALMVGDNPLTDGGAVDAGVAALILPPVPPGAARGLDAAVRMAGVR